LSVVGHEWVNPDKPNIPYLCERMRILLITPPFTQLNTPYPATAYLKGYLNTLGQISRQADLGIEVMLKLFSQDGLKSVFEAIEAKDEPISEESYRICLLRNHYLRTIDPVVAFLQHRDPTLAYSIVERGFLPEGRHFKDLDQLDWAFGTLGIQDHARHLATLYLEDIGELVRECIDGHFGFSRYAERLCRTASDFGPLAHALNEPESLIVKWLNVSLKAHLDMFQPEVVALSIPFPGNLFGALKIAQLTKVWNQDVAVVAGGGFANTELRSLSDPRVFDFFDYVCLDDGEAPFRVLLEHLEGKRVSAHLKRTFLRKEGKVEWVNDAIEKDVPQRDTGVPDYSDLLLDRYLSVMELANPMHRLWSDGRWNKLTLAHGCYWGKCAFCDISLDYIKRYEPITADVICDRMETIIRQTGQRGFHFVDEAAPPALMRDLALEILRRELVVTWWTNIRFEKRFDADLCWLLRASGCVAVSGGLEVASDRLLDRMKKGVTVEQVARVAQSFTNAGVMVHAYLMYGFPTQTAQETIDSLERVRQMFESGVLQSGFWHHFAMTAHSPVGMDPAAYGVQEIGPEFKGFADNDRHHEDPSGADHDAYSKGLRISLFNFMQGSGLDLPLQQWFDFPVPASTVPDGWIESVLATSTPDADRQHKTMVWIGSEPQTEELPDGTLELTLMNSRGQASWIWPSNQGKWLTETIKNCMPTNVMRTSDWKTVSNDFEAQGWGDWARFWQSDPCVAIRSMGWLLV
jgi:hypothetical protein